VGLLNPPILKPLSTGYRIVSGFRRIWAGRNFGLETVPARILDPEADALHCARMAIVDNALQRPLNLIEQSRALALLSDRLPPNRELGSETAALGLPSSPDIIDKLRRLGRLCRPIQEGVLAERLSLPMALELEPYPEDVAASLVQLFATLRLGLNRQREMLTLLREIAAREGRKLEELVAEPAVQSLLGSESGSRPAAGQWLERLRRRRFPRITRRFDQLQQVASALQPGAGIRLSPPSDLEAPAWRLTLSFRSPDELQHQLQRVRDLSRDPRLLKTLEEE